MSTSLSLEMFRESGFSRGTTTKEESSSVPPPSPCRVASGGGRVVKGGVEEVRAESLGMKPMLLRRSSFVTGSVGRVMVVGGSRGGGKEEKVLKFKGFLSTCTASQRVGPKGVVPLWISFQELHRERK